MDYRQNRLQRNNNSSATQILNDLFRDANKMSYEIEGQINTMYNLHAKSQHHVDYER